MAILHNLGFARIGLKRELKFALEAYWRGETSQAQLTQVAEQLRRDHWQIQRDAGLQYIPVGDFSFYDHVLDSSFLLGNIPQRFQAQAADNRLDQYFRVARGRAPNSQPARAAEMTKWFDTNYHYLVPEFQRDSSFSLHADVLLDAIKQAKQQVINAKPVILGPVSYLFLGKSDDGSDRLALLSQLLPVYQQLLTLLAAEGVEWLQIDEPALVLDLDESWQKALLSAYQSLSQSGVKLLLSTYFGSLGNLLQSVAALPVDGLHIDVTRAKADADWLIQHWPKEKVLSLGIVDGRNVWRSDLNALLAYIQPVHAKRGDNLWLAPSCSLLHVPMDLEQETDLDQDIAQWLAFAKQKLEELAVLGHALNRGEQSVVYSLQYNRQLIEQRKTSLKIHKPLVQQRLATIQDNQLQRQQSHQERKAMQQSRHALPLFPTTTIGSFPQTDAIRHARLRYRQGQMSVDDYQQFMQQEIRQVVAYQEEIGLDVLVHGEPERNDMVEYFGEQLEGYCHTRLAWVQSYGSRCVKPPIIYGDVSRPKAMTVAWSAYAQSLTKKPVKGMLTGPVTMLQWSFVRDDQPRSETAKQIALALLDEVQDLEKAGIDFIQVDEPAFREGLPLRQADWQAYLDWAVAAFRLSTCAIKPSTQIHTHMCYSEFNDIMAAVAAMDADVITIETSRSNMELLDVFQAFDYPNDIGPGVYDIHSPNIPSVEQMVDLMEKACALLDKKQLWVNPDCGLKTRQWQEVKPALKAMVDAAHVLRRKWDKKAV